MSVYSGLLRLQGGAGETEEQRARQEHLAATGNPTSGRQPATELRPGPPAPGCITPTPALSRDQEVLPPACPVFLPPPFAILLCPCSAALWHYHAGPLMDRRIRGGHCGGLRKDHRAGGGAGRPRCHALPLSQVAARPLLAACSVTRPCGLLAFLTVVSTPTVLCPTQPSENCNQNQMLARPYTCLT